jgi:hypothetical protein
MKKKFPLISILIFVSVISGYGQSNSWNNITPLRSTRIDVEKLLGKSKEDKCFRCYYRTTKEAISVTYSEGKCKEGWEVPTDTVLSIDVSSELDSGKSFKELKLDKSKFYVTVGHSFDGTWTNAEQGLQYDFSNIELKLRQIRYIPKKSDNHLRCDGFPPFTPEGQYYTRDRYLLYDSALDKKYNLGRIFALSDIFIVDTIKNTETYKGYVVVYFDNKLSLTEYKRQLDKIKEHIFKGFKRNKTSTEHISIIEGGMKERAEIEFYILPKQWKPPAPNPTLPSPQFMKKK